MTNQIFEDIENPDRSEQQLSFIEKTTLIGIYSVGRLVLRKVRKAKTYGDLVKIMETVETAVDNAEDNDFEGNQEKKINSLVEDLKSKI